MDTVARLALHLALGQAEAPAAAAGEAASAMTTASWAYMLIVWGLIVALNVFCFYRLFTRGRDMPHMG